MFQSYDMNVLVWLKESRNNFLMQVAYEYYTQDLYDFDYSFARNLVV